MAADRSFYFDHLYPLQNAVLLSIRAENKAFCLTGGTAASRGYLNHRFSDVLDFFVNDDSRFGLWIERLIFTHDPATGNSAYARKRNDSLECNSRPETFP